MPPFCEAHRRYHVPNPDRRNTGSFTICPDCRLGMPPVATPLQRAVTDSRPTGPIPAGDGPGGGPTERSERE